MNAKTIIPILLVAVSSIVFLAGWTTVQRSLIPQAVEEADSRGESIPTSQTHAIDLIGYPVMWIVWAAIACGVILLFEKRDSLNTKKTSMILAAYLAPPLIVSGFLVIPLFA
jgi:hypothetical protein